MTSPAPLRPAASMLFLRDSPAGVEVFMVVRSGALDFAANALVFPGGKVTEADRVLAKAIMPAPVAADLMGHAVAAAREAYEEAGLLLASPRRTLSDDLVQRRAIDRGQLDFAAFLARCGLTLDLSALLHFAHIIGPVVSPKRFDTHFFIAPMPDHQVPRPDMQEVVAAGWFNARVLMATPPENIVLMKPTRIVLSRLILSASVSEVVADARTHHAPPIEPKVEIRDGRHGLATESHPRFPASWEPMSKQWAQSVGLKDIPDLH